LAAGGFGDNSSNGAAWVYTFTGGNWSQVGSKLTPFDATGSSQFGYSVSLSGNGNTLAIGGFSDNSNIGAAWVFTSSDGNWSQLGNKLVGTNAAGQSQIGYSVSISNDGYTLAVGGPYDNSKMGAVWVYTLSGTNWSQVGNKYVGYNSAAGSKFGFSVSVAGDGSQFVAGGLGDNSGTGAAWLYSNNGLTGIMDSEISQQNIKVFPNPFNQNVWILSEKESPYTIYDLQGIPVEKGNTSSKDIGSQLATGVYLLNVNNVTLKLLKLAN
jgi:hypothetical protein